MLQTNCPKCRGVIQSPYLNDLSSLECAQCKEVVTVENVIVTTKGFTMHRDDLLKRISRYQRLLGEVEKERLLMAKDETVSKQTRQSVEDFYLTLQELLVGARSHFRLEMPYDLYIQIDFDNKIKGKLINLSSEGASIECEMLDKRPRTKAKIKLQLTLPEVPEPLSILAKVVWTRKQTKDTTTEYYNIGVKFMDLDEKVRTSIWNFIVETAS